MPSISMGLHPKLTPLNTKLIYTPTTNYPAVTVFSNGTDNNGNPKYSVYALCYIPTGTLIPKSLEDFQNGDYSGHTPSQCIAIQGSDPNVYIALSYFEDIENIELVTRAGDIFTSRAFAVCYDYNPHGATSYECMLYALEFEYTVLDDSSYEVLFLAQGDLDPELSRGTVTGPAIPPAPTMNDR